MRANAKYTAREILTAAGVENPESKFGKMRVVIAGLRGIVNPDYQVSIPAGSKSLDVVVGNENFTVELEEGDEDRLISEGAKKAGEAKAKKVEQQNLELAKAKKEAREKELAEAKAETPVSK